MTDKKVLIGVLLDVSGSMRQSVPQVDINQQKKEWARSVFTVIDDLASHDLSPNHHIFALGFGGRYPQIQMFNILDIMEKINLNQNISIQQGQNIGKSHMEMIDQIFDDLMNSGAPLIKQWATPQQVYKNTTLNDIATLYNVYKSNQLIYQNKSFKKYFIQHILPKKCLQKSRSATLITKKISQSTGLDRTIVLTNVAAYAGMALNLSFPYLFPGMLISIGVFVNKKLVEHKISSETSKQIKQVIQNSKKVIQKSKNKVFTVKQAHSIITQTDRSYLKKQLTDDRISQNLKSLEPYIYGGTPFFKTLKNALTIFEDCNYKQHEKVLFIVSDGQPTDDVNHQKTKQEIKKQLDKAGITTIGCYITRNNNIKPQTLYSKSQKSWQKGGKLMFDLSSTIKTTQIPIRFFIKKNWSVEESLDNETKLFIHANHPKNLQSACELARCIIQQQKREALSELITQIDLSIYINDVNNKNQEKPDKQVGGTCYAHATSAVMHMAIHRIKGRTGGYPQLKEIRQKLIEQYGKKGSSTFNVLKQKCPQYRLRVQQVDINGAKKAISMKRPVVARFSLIKSQWVAFSQFFKNNKTGILTLKQLNKLKQVSTEKGDGGHAVVLVDYCKDYLRFMNSWGQQWADGGLFKIANTDVLKLQYFDVFWYESDLTPGERQYFSKNYKKQTKTRIQQLLAIENAKTNCKKCLKQSLIKDFKGTFLNAQCPYCDGIFPTKGQPLLALAIYLNSLIQY